MNLKQLDRAGWLRLASVAVLIAGLVAGAAIYVVFTVAPPDQDYQLPETKAYLRQLELYGGKGNVLASDLRGWFDSLWHGRRLGPTVAVLGLLLSGGLRFAAIPLPDLEGEDALDTPAPPAPPNRSDPSPPAGRG
jgi:hypothetical protein